MSNLVTELKEDHKKIVAVLAEVKAKGITSKEGVQVLVSAKAALLAHLKKEDTFLYPELRKAAQSNSGLKSTLDVFAKDMDKITAEVLAFFDKYSNGGSGIEFAKDIGHLLSVLGARIQREENSLYSEFDKLPQKKAA